jgi:hypothetical protein
MHRCRSGQTVHDIHYPYRDHFNLDDDDDDDDDVYLNKLQREVFKNLFPFPYISIRTSQKGTSTKNINDKKK